MRYIVLAAGASRRMGFDKVFEPLHGEPPILRIVRALGSRPTIVVASSARAADVRAMAPLALLVANDEPERGMTHSLRLGLANLGVEEAFGVILGDMPYVTEALLDSLEAHAGEGDVVFPVRTDGSRPGHPVLFSARARLVVESLPDGDTLRDARDDVRLTRSAVPIEDRGAYVDLDSPEQWWAADA